MDTCDVALSSWFAVVPLREKVDSLRKCRSSMLSPPLPVAYRSTSAIDVCFSCNLGSFSSVMLGSDMVSKV